MTTKKKRPMPPVVASLSGILTGALLIGAMVYTIFGLSGLPSGERNYAASAGPTAVRHAGATVLHRRAGWMDMLRFDSGADRG